MITELEFKSLAAQGFNRIPLIAEAFADLETPLSLYLKLAGGGQALEFEFGDHFDALVHAAPSGLAAAFEWRVGRRRPATGPGR